MRENRAAHAKHLAEKARANGREPEDSRSWDLTSLAIPSSTVLHGFATGAVAEPQR